jgi:glycosyltransferase involved in cell wall biosynthesis
MSLDPAQVWVVFPVYNEFRTLPQLIADVHRLGMRCLVVDDGSEDGSSAFADAADAVVRFPSNRGYEQAVAGGFAYLAQQRSWRWAVTVDSDGQFSVDDVAFNLAAADEAGAQIMAGARESLPRLSEKLAAACLKPLLGIRDPFCGVKAFRAEIVARYGATAGRRVNLEMLARAKLGGARVVERVLNVTQRRFGASRFGGLGGERRLIVAFLAVLFLCLRTRTT